MSRLRPTSSAEKRRSKLLHGEPGATRLRAMIDLARHMLAVSADIFDRDPFALNCLNGTLDLRTGKLKPHDPADFITKLIELDYEPKAKAPRWLTFLSEVLRDGALISYVQRAIGYSVTGDQRAECMFVAVATVQTAKAFSYDLIREAIGPYGSTGRPELLIRQRLTTTRITKMLRYFVVGGLSRSARPGKGTS